jgi:hypothetical protein
MNRSMKFLILVTLTLTAGATLAACMNDAGRQDIGQPQQPGVATQTEVAIPSDSLSAAKPGSVEIIGGDESTLREFVNRWFAPRYASSDALGETRIWIAALPQGDENRFPLPPGARVIGSLQEPGVDLAVLVDVPNGLDAVLKDYHTILIESGWALVEEPNGQAGFVVPSPSWLTYCQEQDQAILIVEAFSGVDGQTELRLNRYTQDLQNMCAPDQDVSMDPAYEMLPTLTLPSGALLSGGGSSSAGGGSADSSSEIRTDLMPTELAAYVAPQMVSAGWQLLDEGGAETFAWSNWTFLDDHGEAWRGNLIILGNQGAQDRVFALVRVVRMEE